MSTLLVACGDSVVGRRAGMRDRLMARLQAHALDRELARGVAQVQLLLSDGIGPLYFRGATEELRARVANALNRLEVLDER